MRIKLDASEVRGLLKIDFDAANFRNVPLELLNILLGIGEAPEKFFRFECDGFSASGARELTIRLEPTDFFRGCMAALRAGNGDFGIVKESGHAVPPDATNHTP